MQVLSNQRHDLSVPGPSHLRELEVSEELSSTQVNEGLGVIPLLGSPNTTLASSDSTYESIYHTLVIGGPSRHQAVRQVLHDYDPSNLPFSFKHTLFVAYPYHRTSTNVIPGYRYTSTTSSQHFRCLGSLYSTEN